MRMSSIAGVVPASARASWYAVASALVAALVAWGVLDEQVGPAVAGVMVSLVTLLFAVLHSTSPVRQAIYSVAGAVGTLGLVLGWGTEVQMTSLLAVLGPVLGLGTAAATTDYHSEP